MPGGGPRMQNFQNIPGGTGGLGGGPGGQALSLARRMTTQPIGADPRPSNMGMGVQQGMQAGGHPDVHMAYNDQVTRKLPMSDQKASGKMAAKAESKADNSKALQEIAHLMGPGLPDPFQELQGYQQHQQTPFPGAPLPRAAPASIRPEPGIQDPTKDLPLSLIYRLGLRAYLGAGSEPLSSYATQSSQNPMDPLRDTALAGLPTIREKPAKATPTSRGAARRVMEGQKRGGVAKKALALAKRRKKGSSKRR